VGKVRAADLFCGAGGFSTGLMNACRDLGLSVELLAINHWNIAIATHSANHPTVEHMCESLDGVDPRKVVPDGRLDILMASPECTHHSNARGGKPMSDQSRATAWHVLRWAEALYIDHIIVENVREFRNWGPLGSDGRPLKSKQGALYRQFLSSLRALGYTVDVRILNAADYGDATTRHRLFIQARRGRKRIEWPEPTHLPAGSLDMSEGAQPYRTAREIIDWDIPGKSIYGRKKPLSENTMRRIMTGLQKYSGLPYLVKYYGGHDACSVDEPLPTVTANYEHYGLCNPFLVVLRNNCDAKSVDGPVPTIAAHGNHIGLCEPFLVEYHGSHKGKSDGDNRVTSVDAPLRTLDTSNRFGIAQPFLVNLKGQSVGRSIDAPTPTITSHAPHLYLAEPFLLKYNGEGGGPRSVDAPLDTITAKDRFGLVCPEMVDEDDDIAVLDIRFRMLQPHELAAAMSFPEGYQFAGNRDEKVRQIGNAVPVNLAAALCREALS
jgi:DNA (cytosine-5)-methyltransferase 1